MLTLFILPLIVIPSITSTIILLNVSYHEIDALYDRLILERVKSLLDTAQKEQDLMSRTGIQNLSYFKNGAQKRTAAWIENTGFPGQVFLIADASKRVVYSSQNLADHPYGAMPFTANTSTKPKSQTIMVHSKQQKPTELAGYTINFQPWDWQIFIGSKKSVMYQGLEPVVITAILINAFGLVATLGIILLLVLLLSKPVIELKDFAIRISHGDFEIPAKSYKAEELTILSTEINSLAMRMQAFTKNLEQLVGDRSAKLERSLEELKNMQQSLVQSERLATLAGLTASLHHEVNTPLGLGATLAGHALEELRTLEKNLTDNTINLDQLHSFVQRNTEATKLLISNLDRANHLLQNFRVSAADQVQEEARFIIVKEFIDELVFTLSPQLKKIGVQVKLEGEYNLYLKMYPGSLWHILSNLILNSIKHGFERKKDTATITIAWHMEYRNLVLNYQDNGSGIASEHLPRLFKPFFTTRKGQGGTGLGLYIIKNIITEKLKGTIQCTSRPGEGVLFTMRIPVDLQ